MSSRDNLRLEADAEELRAAFNALQHPRQVAELLKVSYSTLTYWLYRATDDERYETFTLPKRSGGERIISAPKGSLKILQSKLRQVLDAVYRPKKSVHGFVTSKSILTNAQRHLRKRYVLNLDLQDFFPAINFGRVRGMFMAVPYRRPNSVATVLAQLCCNGQWLPQGAPSSPIVSNMLCAKLDAQLYRLARRHHCAYTRFADDLTFSTTRSTFPSDLAIRLEDGTLEIGEELRHLIGSNGFTINPEKTRLQSRDDRQEVTGVIVNTRENPPRSFLRQVRSMLHAWEKYGLEAAEKEHYKKYAKHRRPDSPAPSFRRIVRGKVSYIGMIRGIHDLNRPGFSADSFS